MNTMYFHQTTETPRSGAPVPPAATPAPLLNAPMPPAGVPTPLAGAPVQPAGTPVPAAGTSMPAGGTPFPPYVQAQGGPFMPAPLPPQAAAMANPPATNGEVERWFGGKFLGVAAAVLVLTGLVLVGITFIPQIPNAIKAAFMFACALLLTGAGTICARKKANPFTFTLLGCGMLAFFVAIYATYYGFNLISAPAAFALSIGWMAATLVLLKLCNAWVLSVVLCAVAGLAGIPTLESFGELFAPAYAATLTYCVGLGLLGIHLANGQENAHEQRKRALMLASLVTTECMVAAIALASAWHYSMETSMVVLAAILIALKFTPAPALLKEANTQLRINELSVLFACGVPLTLMGIAGGGPSAPAAVLLSAFIFLVAVLVVARAVDLFNPNLPTEHPAFPVLQAFVGTALLLSYLVDGMGVVNSAYVWSAVFMACGLVAISVGFAARHKQLRLYGLVATLLGVAKIALLDASGSPLERALGLLVGGLVCFAISALYNFATKRLEEPIEH